MIDLHNHMLPGLDDGAADWEECLGMARLAVEDGVLGIVCTPHWIAGVYHNSRSTILECMELCKAKLRDRGIHLDLYPGSELRLDGSLPKKIKSREVLTLNDGGRYVLIELPGLFMAHHVERFLWQLLSQGITPVIGHPERNIHVQQQPEELSRWIKMGALVQVTGASLLGHFGKPARDFTRKLLEHRMVHIVSTDAHDMHDRAPRLSLARRALDEMVGEEDAALLTFVTPRRILQGEPLKPETPLPFGGRSSFWKKLWGGGR